MKICFVTYDVNKVGGIERVIALLSYQFTENFHWELDILSLYSTETKPFFPHCEQAHIIHGGAQEDYKAGIAFMKKYLKDPTHPYDFIFTFHLYLAGPMAPLIHQLPGKPQWIATEHNSVYFYKFKRKLLNFFMYRPASSLVLLTDKCRDYYRRQGYRNAVTIPNAVSFEINQQTDLAHHTILAIGRVERIKGFDMLIDAFSRLAEEFPDWRLRILGDGTELEALRQQVQSLGLEHRIDLPGYTTDVQDHLLKASFLCMTTRGGFEGFPMTALEALECGVPIAAYEMYQLQEMAGGSPCIQFVKDQDVDDLTRVMRKLMSDPVFLSSISQAAKERASFYHMEYIGSLWKELLEKQSQSKEKEI